MLCLNFVEGGGCHVTGRKCFLGLSGAYAGNRDGGCKLHGMFDVWVTRENQLLITDMGFPSEEPKQCLALGVNEKLARKIASNKVSQLRTSILTTERICFRCEKHYWISEHPPESGLLEIGSGYLCPHCARESKSIEDSLGVLRYWCG